MMKSQVETVLGAINAEDLAITFTHEHVTMDCSYCMVPPRNESEKAKLNEPVTLSNLNWLRHNPYSCLANMKLAAEKDAVIADLGLLKKTGGSTIVKNTSIGINRDIGSMIEISKATGVNIVCGTGYFVAETFPGEMKSASVEKLTEVCEGTVVFNRRILIPGVSLRDIFRIFGSSGTDSEAWNVMQYFWLCD